MTTIFHARTYSRFMEVQSKLRRRKLHRTNQDSDFLGDSFSKGDNVTGPSNLEEKDNLSILKDDFSSRTDPSIFTSRAPELLHWSNEQAEFFQHWNQQTTSSYTIPKFPECEGGNQFIFFFLSFSILFGVFLPSYH